MHWFDSGFFMYMAEAEGLDTLVDTRETRVNAIIREIRSLLLRNSSGYLITNDDFNTICAKHSLTPTDKELNYIKKELHQYVI